MPTDCRAKQLEIEGIGGRCVIADVVVDGLPALVGQWILGMARGYEDVSDHDDLRHDSVLALLTDRLEPKRHDSAVLAA